MIVLNIRSGQQAHYQDSVYEYHIISNDEQDKVLEHCLTKILTKKAMDFNP